LSEGLLVEINASISVIKFSEEDILTAFLFLFNRRVFAAYARAFSLSNWRFNVGRVAADELEDGSDLHRLYLGT
jgi:hypothetical protein